MDEPHAITIADLVRITRLKRGFPKGLGKYNDEMKAALAARTAAIRREIDVDLLLGLPARGRAARIARRLHRREDDGYSRRTVARILAILAA